MKKAFTLAEVLMTLVIIGVVAVMVIPGVIEKYSERAQNTAAELFSKRLNDVVKRMITNGDLNFYASTEDFVNRGMKKYIKIDKVCDSEHLADCFVAQIDKDGEIINTSELKAADNFGLEGWETRPVSILFNNGTSAIFIYNPNHGYYQDYIGDVSTANVVSGIFDVNTYKSPNKYLKDIRPLGVSLLQTQKPLMTCDELRDDYVAGSMKLQCETLSNGKIKFSVADLNSSSWSSPSYDACISQCQKYNGHMFNLEDMQSYCAEGLSFPWWYWIYDENDTGSSATAVYGACSRVEKYSKTRNNFTCGCIGN